MLRFLIRRTLSAVLVLVAVSGLTFVMFFALPRDPVTALCPKHCSTERQERIRRDLGLREPIYVQYASYVQGLFVGRDLGSALGGRCEAPCLGYSYVNGEPVSRTIGRTLPVTLSIVLPAGAAWMALGVALGLISALRPGTVIDRIAIGLSLTWASVQLYLVGALLLLVFSSTLHLLPSPHYSPLRHGPLAWASGLVLAWVALALQFAAGYARLSRAQLLETLSEDFVRTARAKGLRESAVVGRHVLRATVAPLLTIAGIDIGSAVGGTFITEITFGLQGMGRTAWDAVRAGDLPTIMATVLTAAAGIVVANLAVDVLCAVADPHIRLG